MSLVTDVADAIVAQLNHGSFSQAFTAARRYDPRRKLTELDTLRVDVVPGDPSLEAEKIDRDAWQNDVTIDVCARVQVDDAEIDTLDPLNDFVETELVDYFRGNDLAVPPLTFAENFGSLDGWYVVVAGDGNVELADGVCRLATGDQGDASIVSSVDGLVIGENYRLRFTIANDAATVKVVGSSTLLNADYAAASHDCEFTADAETVNVSFSAAGDSDETTDVSDVTMLLGDADKVAEFQSLEFVAVADPGYLQTKGVYFSLLRLTYRIHTGE